MAFNSDCYSFPVMNERRQQLSGALNLNMLALGSRPTQVCPRGQGCIKGAAGVDAGLRRLQIVVQVLMGRGYQCGSVQGKGVWDAQCAGPLPLGADDAPDPEDQRR